MNNTGQDASYSTIHILKASSHAWPVIERWHNGQREAALNWRELAPDALASIETEVRERWALYWEQCCVRAAVVRHAQRIDDMMKPILVPSSSYPCPAHLAARAVWPTATNATGRDALLPVVVVEGEAIPPAQRGG